MRKLFFLFLAFFALETAQAQSKIGIKLAPTLSTSRVSFTSTTPGTTVSSNGVGGRFIFGPIFDILIAENYYFTTGLLYVPKRIGIRVNEAGTGGVVDQTYRLQYLRLPAGLKLFTNELALDTRVYFELGGLLDIKIADRPQEAYPFRYLEKTRLFDFGIQLGSGVEYRLGYNTILFGGIFYNRGLVNAVTKTRQGLDINVKNDLIGLDLGVKF